MFPFFPEYIPSLYKHPDFDRQLDLSKTNILEIVQ